MYLLGGKKAFQSKPALCEKGNWLPKHSNWLYRVVHITAEAFCCFALDHCPAAEPK